MSGSGRDENKRLPMPWTLAPEDQTLPPEGADQKQRLKAGVLQQEGDPDSLLSFYRGLLGIRSQLAWFTDATVEAADLGSPRLAGWRLSAEGREALVIHNLSAERLSIPLPPGSRTITWDCGHGAASTSAQELVLPPYSGCIRLP